MTKQFYILFILLIYSVDCLSQNICTEYTGYGTASNINGSETYSYTRTSGSWDNITIKVPMTSSESLEHNSKTIGNKYVSSNINPDSYNIEYDSYGNEIHVLTFSENPSIISVTREYNGTVYNNIPENECFSDNFPPSSIPGDVLQYLDPTTNIQSGNSSIISLAQSITNGCTSMHQAVEKIAEWVRGYISYNTNNSIPQDAVAVIDRKNGNCRGFTNISLALLRSVGIPARYVSGVLLPKSYNIPYKTTGHITMGTKGPGFHATHEIYYPSEWNWVCGDGQSTVHFTSVNFLKTNHADDGNETINKISAVLSPDFTFTQSSSLSSSIGNISANYSYKNDYPFSGTNSGIVLVKGYMNCIPTGINDEVAIINGPDNFKTGENVYYEAEFTSGSGYTYPVNWSWQILLYHSGGTYNLCNETDGLSFWYPTTTPLLPSYNWLIDPVGKIYGEVVVTVEISDGDFKTDKLAVSVEECQGINIINQTYSTNTTEQGCYITLENVNVQNGAKLTLDSEMGITIDSDFNVALGSEFETQ